MVHVEVGASSAVLAEARGAVERNLAALQPAFAPQILPILALTLLPRLALSRSRPRIESTADHGEEPHDDEKQNQLGRQFERDVRLLLREEHAVVLLRSASAFNYPAGYIAR